jgi:hypothetical protein
VDRRKRVLNFQESAVDRMLADYAKEHGYRINLKMRLRDVIDVDDLPLSAKERDFAFTSHLDFVAVDTRAHLPVIAIEYDGPQHLTDHKQIERDRIKDKLCEAAELPLLRIDNLFTRREGRWRVLTYILWAHEMGKAYYEAVGDRPVSEDDGFDAGTMLLPKEDESGLEFSMLGGRGLTYLIGFRQRHEVEWEVSWWRDRDGQVETRYLVALANGQFLVANCAIRDFAIEGISALEISQELVIAEIAWLAQQYEDGDPVALSAAQRQQILEDVGPYIDSTKIQTVNGWSFYYSYGEVPV